MGDLHATVQADNPRSTLERVGGTHAGFQLAGIHRVTLKNQQAGIQHLLLRLRLHAEQLKQRGITHLVRGHVRLLIMAASSCSSSSRVMLLPPHCSTPALKRLMVRLSSCTEAPINARGMR